MLIVRVLDVTNDDAAANDEDVLTTTRMQVNSVYDGTTESNRVV